MSKQKDEVHIKEVKEIFTRSMLVFSLSLTYELDTSNGVIEGINSIIQSVKRRARGYGTTKYFISMVYLVCSDLEFNLPTAFA